MIEFSDDFIRTRKIKDGWFIEITRNGKCSSKTELMKWLKSKGFVIVHKEKNLIQGVSK